MRYDYQSVLNMAVWERRIYLDLWQRELEDQKAEYDKAKSKSKK